MDRKPIMVLKLGSSVLTNGTTRISRGKLEDVAHLDAAGDLEAALGLSGTEFLVVGGLITGLKVMPIKKEGSVTAATKMLHRRNQSALPLARYI